MPVTKKESIEELMSFYETHDQGLTTKLAAFISEFGIVADRRLNPKGTLDQSKPFRIHLKTKDWLYLGSIHNKNTKSEVSDDHAYVYLDGFKDVDANGHDAIRMQMFETEYKCKLLTAYPTELQEPANRNEKRKSIRLFLMLNSSDAWRLLLNSYIAKSP